MGGLLMVYYKIVRYYAPHLNKRNYTVATHKTLDEAQAHCNREDTRKEGVYFEGYAEQ